LALGFIPLRLKQQFALFRLDQIAVSSAYISVSEFCIKSGKSLMQIEKNNGPKMDPCGTPTTRGSGIDVFPAASVRLNMI